MKLSLSRRTDLALMALRMLAASADPLKGSDLAERIGTSLSFLPQIMAPLIQRRWVASERGPGGGYRLTSHAGEARLLDVIEANEGPAEDGRCVMRDGPCPGDPSCPIHLVWMEARQVLVDGFAHMPAYVVKEGVAR